MVEEVTGPRGKLGRKRAAAEAAVWLLDDAQENTRLQTTLRLCRAEVGLHYKLKRELNILLLTKIYS